MKKTTDTAIYYMIGDEGNKESDFVKYDNLQNMADELYGGDMDCVNKAIERDLIFTPEEYAKWIDEITLTRSLQMQYEYNGEWFDIWETTPIRKNDLQAAWNEIDNQPEEGGYIRFKGEYGTMAVNGGF